jgi:hypothetical protein
MLAVTIRTGAFAVGVTTPDPWWQRFPASARWLGAAFALSCCST